jgi:chorismate-pyruvate lyase
MPEAQQISSPVERAWELVGRFVEPPALFGAIESLGAENVPEPARTLLDHRSHMTVAMERFHGGPVGLRVAAVAPPTPGRGSENGLYTREILLTRPASAPVSGERIVQYGIVGIDLSRLPDSVVLAIRDGGIPLGRILINAGLAMVVQDVELLRVRPGPHLLSRIGVPADGQAVAYARVASISIAGHRVIRLLELIPHEWTT